MRTFAEVADFSTELALGKKGNSAVWFDALPGKGNLWVGPRDMKQAFYVRPISGLSKGCKFEINLRVDEANTEFKAACQALDDFVLKSVFGRKDEILGSKATYIKSPDALFPLYATGKLLKDGKPAADGTMYPSTIKLQVLGKWADYVESCETKTVTMRGAPRSIVDRCIWKPRTEALEPGETRFYLWTRTNDKGEDVYAEKITMADGSVRLVGPEDCTPGSEVTPVFSLACLYMNEGIGVSAAAKALYIKPRAPTKTGAGSGFSAETSPISFIPSFAVVDSAPADEIMA